MRLWSGSALRPRVGSGVLDRNGRSFPAIPWGKPSRHGGAVTALGRRYCRVGRGPPGGAPVSPFSAIA